MRGMAGAACALLGALLLAASLQASAQPSAPPAIPRFDSAKHLGVGSCAGPCHGRQAALGVAEGPAVRGSEILVWQDANSSRGAHSGAYASLLSERGRSIARNLGLANAATAPECLSCHADFVPTSRRGEEFQISDGVSCEACHGGAGPWLASHYAPDATHAGNVAAGMFPTSDLKARAQLCATCHLGAAAADQFATHRIMGAGHPRLAFEVELFTSLQAHHFEDENYAARKPKQPRAKAWAIGQAVALRATLELYQKRSGAGVFPELAFYDCHSCHRPISDAADAQSRWRPNPGRPLGPGMPIFNDSNLIMLSAALQPIAPKLAAELDSRGRALHAAQDPAAVRAAASALSQSAGEALSTLERSSFDARQTQAALRAVVSASLSERYTAYSAAEQAIMAVDSLQRGLIDEGRISATQVDRATPAIEAAYAAVADPNAYDQAVFRERLSAVAVALGVS